MPPSWLPYLSSGLNLTAPYSESETFDISSAVIPSPALEKSVSLPGTQLPHSQLFLPSGGFSRSASWTASSAQAASEPFSLSGLFGEQPGPDSGSNRLGLILGIVVGALCFVMLVIGLLMYVRYQRLHKKKVTETDDNDHTEEFYDRCRREKEHEMSVDFQNPLFETGAGLEEDEGFGSDAGE
jgi:hypothetical protein